MKLLDQAYTDWIEKGYTGRIKICVGIDLKLYLFGVLIKPI